MHNAQRETKKGSLVFMKGNVLVIQERKTFFMQITHDWIHLMHFFFHHIHILIEGWWWMFHSCAFDECLSTSKELWVTMVDSRLQEHDMDRPCVYDLTIYNLCLSKPANTRTTHMHMQTHTCKLDRHTHACTHRWMYALIHPLGPYSVQSDGAA